MLLMFVSRSRFKQIQAGSSMFKQFQASNFKKTNMSNLIYTNILKKNATMEQNLTETNS